MLDGPKKLVKRAKVAARYLGVDPSVDVRLRWASRKDDSGWCGKRGDHYIIGISPLVEKCMLIEVVGHEMVHVKQYACGDMVDVLEGVLWKGELFPDPVTRMEYLLSPWEMEARSLEYVIREVWEAR